MTIPQALDLALQRHQSGRLAEAETLYRQILAVEPRHAEALQHLGVIALQAGRYGLAVALNPFAQGGTPTGREGSL
jgi:protein O-GlcNAc transferase